MLAWLHFKSIVSVLKIIISYIQIYFLKENVYFTVTFSEVKSLSEVQLYEMYHAQTLRYLTMRKNSGDV